MCIAALPQYESTKAHMPKEPDELSLQQAEVVIVLQEVDGKDSLQNLLVQGEKRKAKNLRVVLQNILCSSY